MNSCDVLVTYCWNRVGYNIIRSLALHGLKVWVADTSERNICSMSKYCSGSFVYPDYKTDELAFIAFLREKLLELNPKVLLPTHDESVVIMKHRSELPCNVIIPYVSYDKLVLLANKAKSTALASSAGVPTPKVYASIDEVESYPIVLKTVIGNSAKGVYFPKSKEDLVSLYNEHKNEELLMEEWVEGTDYSVDCIRWKGFWKASVYHALVTKTDGGGTTTQREMVNFPILEEYAKKYLDAVDFTGVCGLDFRYSDKNNRIAYIETNVRFTGGLATPITAGFDIPWVLYKLATEDEYKEPIRIKIGTRTKWILGDIITLVGRLIKFNFKWSELKQVFTFRGFDAFDDFYWDDKKAMVGEFYYYFEKLVKNRKLNP